MVTIKKHDRRRSVKQRIVDTIIASRRGHTHGYDGYLFAWNVKAYCPDLSFKNLLKRYRTTGYLESHQAWWLSQKDLRRKLRRLLDRTPELEGWAAQNAQEMVTETGSYSETQSGKDVDVEFGFFGRQGGWLVVTKLFGHKFGGRERVGDYREWLDGLDLDQLMLLVEYLRDCDRWFTQEAAREEIEHQAGLAFFNYAFRWAENKFPPMPEDNKGAGI